MKTVSICVATCDRNEMLLRCLSSIVKSANNENKYQHSLIVVDNNKYSVSKNITLGFKGDIDVIYDWEPVPGIPFARNRCLNHALEKGSDFIIFIDDDECVDADWLYCMLSSIDEDDVDVISGSVNQISDGIIISKRNFSDGALRAQAETDNVIFKSWLAKKIKFDEDFAQTGGSDTLFFRRAVELGAVIKVCTRAIVTEEMPESRRGIGWRLRRHYRYGLTHCMIERKLASGASPLFLFFRALVLIPIGCGEYALRIIFNGSQDAKVGLDRLMRGLGSLSYFFGIKYNEYKR
jgi:GT2 family glycosyltransferase